MNEEHSRSGALSEAAAAYQAGLVLRDEILSVARLVEEDIAVLSQHEALPVELTQAVALMAAMAPGGVGGHGEELAALDVLLAEHGSMDSATLGDVYHWRDGLVNLAHHLRGVGNHVYDRLQRLRTGAESFHSAATVVDPEDIARVKTVNAVTADLELLARESRPSSFPKFLIVDPTNACNFRCRTCFQSVDQTFHHAQLQPRVLDRLASILPFVDEVKFFGTGEPTLARDLPAFVAWAHHFGCRTDILTNGSTLAKRPIPLEHLTRLGVSVDGAGTRTFQAIRVGMSFEQIILGLREVRRLAPKLKIYLNVTVSRPNLDEIEALTRLAVDLGVDEIQWNQIHPYMLQLRPLALRPSDQPLHDEQMRRSVKLCERHGIAWRSDVSFAGLAEDGEVRDKERLLAYLEAMQFDDGRGEKRDLDQMRRAFADYPFHWQPPMLADRLPPYRPRSIASPPSVPPVSIGIEPLQSRHDALFERLISRARAGEAVCLPHCTAPWTRFYVESSGRVRPCCVYTGYLGDLNEFSIEQIWHGESYITLRRAMFDTDNLPLPCRGCNSSERYHYLEHAVVLLERAGVARNSVVLPIDLHPPARLLAQLELLAQAGSWRARLRALQRRVQGWLANFTASDTSLAQAYWGRYPDVRQSEEYGISGRSGAPGARLHYIRHGRREGRVWGL